jgi:hypothetical protein
MFSRAAHLFGVARIASACEAYNIDMIALTTTVAKQSGVHGDMKNQPLK